MKIPLVGFAFLLIMASFALAFKDPPTELPEGDDQPIPGPVNCCLKYASVQVPLDRLVGYEYANSRCSIPAVIFKTKKNRAVCANPAENWVQDRIKHLPPPN